ncbi:MAG: hypothetical protein NC818_06935 [Candidatus Omnitrophica bacterium]|nr:hypothetical protein [Candidatus Omnitrophota bacterium]
MNIEKIEWQKLNKILLGIFLLLLGWFLLDIFLNLGKTKEILITSSEEQERTVTIDDLKPIPQFKQYEQAVRKRQLFKGTLSQEKVVSPDTATQHPNRIYPSDFQLLGIAAGANPQAIILNKKTNQTYFLYSGQGQDNLKVEEISGNKVKLNYGGETFELFL